MHATMSWLRKLILVVDIVKKSFRAYRLSADAPMTTTNNLFLAIAAADVCLKAGVFLDGTFLGVTFFTEKFY